MTVPDTDQPLAGCSLRQLQLYAAACLAAYCERKGIGHPSVDDLLKHLEGYPEKGSLLAWERAGALLALNGRGDDWPQELAALIAPEEVEAFACIVDSAVEVGIVELYGDSTDLPLTFVRKITSLLRRNAIELPDPPGITAI
ncbi:hypothetical protein GV819_08510 [Pseudomonas sp. Fl5BN2]|uniref:hypothetical protein n=1 Tax=unclassified Pseudomonas TaxID=196821 RepID=UPI001376AE9E|nr:MULTISPECIES: hypothetical protein [unclassified Pseudomonas]NBF02334.1 hypothetical protein [Pseudomonas sp. Fl5BN2]NBF11977.1 hypothetical protein [Pseudomonas sp. Fl4BN1]